MNVISGLPDNVTLPPRDQVEEYLGMVLLNSESEVVMVAPSVTLSQDLLKFLHLPMSEVFLDIGRPEIMRCGLDGNPFAYVLAVQLCRALLGADPDVLLVIPKTDAAVDVFTKLGVDVTLKHAIMAGEKADQHTKLPTMYINAIDTVDAVAAAHLRAHGPDFQYVDPNDVP